MQLALALSLLTLSAAPEAPRRVYVGAYLSDVSDFDLKAGRFKADVIVWQKWMGKGAPPAITFENGELDSKEELGAENDGAWHSLRWRVQGTFRGDFPVHAFPFDRQTLRVVLGLPDSEGVLVPDLGASGMSTAFSITGWDYEPYFSARSDEKIFSSDLGSVNREGQSTRLNRVAFAVELRRPTTPYIFKFALPLVLILLMALLALLLPATHIEVRSAMAVTGLLSCIAFQYSQSQSLPDVSYLVAADAFFLGAYVFVTATLVVSVISFRNREKRPWLALWGDRVAMAALPLATVLSAVWVASAASSEPVPLAAPPAEERPSFPVLKVGVTALESLNAGGLPPRRGQAVVRGADGEFRPVLVDEAPAMTNELVRLLPGGGMRVRWRLRADARWSDGTPITALDLMFSLNTSLNPLRTGIEVIDPRTLDVTWAVRRADWLEGFSIYPRTTAMMAVYADGGRDAMGRGAIEAGIPTSGPYVVETFEAGKLATLKRNPYASGPPAIFERFELQVFPSAGEAATALLEGKIDVISAVGGESLTVLQGKKDVRLLEQVGDLLYVLVPNLSEGPWADLKARQALMQVVDREALLRILTPLPSQVATAWRPDFKSSALPRFARSEGMKALEQLGLKGTELPLHVMKQKNKTSNYSRMVESLAEDFRAAGLAVEVVEHAEMNPLFLKRDHQGLIFTSRDTTDPVRYLNVPYDQGHYAVEEPLGPYFDAPMVAAYERYASSLYEERRGALEKELQTLWVERLPMLPLVLTSRVVAVRSDLKGPELGQADGLYWNLADWRR